MGQSHAIRLAIACGEGLPFQPLTVIEIAEQRPLGPCRASVNPFVVSPEEHHVDRPCVISMFRHPSANAYRQRIESRPVIPVIRRHISWRRVRSLLVALSGIFQCLLLPPGWERVWQMREEQWIEPVFFEVRHKTGVQGGADSGLIHL